MANDCKKYIGKTFSRLKIVGLVGINKKRERIVSVECKCGNKKNIQLYLVKCGIVKSCGCLRNEKSSERFKVHGLRYHQLYNVWCGMKARCYNENSPNFKYYGLIGVRVCQRWLNSFTQFYIWSIKNGWHKGLQIDRFPNQKGNYEPKNCRFVDRITQMNNFSRNVVVKIGRQNIGLNELSKKFNIKRSTLAERLRSGWDLKKALNKATRK